jgi:hypothetical protein
MLAGYGCILLKSAGTRFELSKTEGGSAGFTSIGISISCFRTLFLPRPIERWLAHVSGSGPFSAPHNTQWRIPFEPLVGCLISAGSGNKQTKNSISAWVYSPVVKWPIAFLNCAARQGQQPAEPYLLLKSCGRKSILTGFLFKISKKYAYLGRFYTKRK